LKGRCNPTICRGEKHGNAKLTSQEVLAIRHDREVRGLKLREVAVIYNISEGTVSAIEQRKIWGWLPANSGSIW